MAANWYTKLQPKLRLHHFGVYKTRRFRTWARRDWINLWGVARPDTFWTTCSLDCLWVISEKPESWPRERGLCYLGQYLWPQQRPHTVWQSSILPSQWLIFYGGRACVWQLSQTQEMIVSTRYGDCKAEGLQELLGESPSYDSDVHTSIWFTWILLPRYGYYSQVRKQKREGEEGGRERGRKRGGGVGWREYIGKAEQFTSLNPDDLVRESDGYH